MKSLFFWNTWYSTYRWQYWLWLILFTATAFLYVTTYFYEDSLISQWQIINTLEENKHKLGEVNVGIFSIPVEGEMFLITQHYEAGQLRIPLWLYSAYGIIIALATVLLLSVISTLRSLWFGVGMTVFFFFLAYLKLDYLGAIRSVENGTMFVCLAVFLPVSFGLQTFGKNVPLWMRVLIFSGLTAGMSVWLGNAALVKYPLLYVVNYGAMIPIGITLLFISITAHELPRAFFTMIIRYNREGGDNNTLHFLVITDIYLLHLILYYFEITETFRLGLTYITPFWLLLIGSILGIWGCKHRASLLTNILPFEPQGALTYLALGMISLGTIAFYTATGNDPMTDVFHDFTLYSYIAFGIAFLVYVLMNFTELIKQRLEVEKILYDGKLVPFYIVRYFGFAGVLAFVVAGKYMLYAQTLAGFYNGVGDIYDRHGDTRMAKFQYQIAQANDFYNVRTNYALASLANKAEDLSEEVSYLHTLLKRRPVRYAYIRLSNILRDNERTYDALFELREGVKKLPTDVAMNNNLALLYKDRKVLDSAFYFLERAEKSAGSNPIPQNNLWAILAEREAKGNNLESLPAIKDEARNLIGRANKLALFNKSSQQLTLMPLQNTPITATSESFAYVYNYGLNRLGKADKLVNEQLTAFNKKDTLQRESYRTQFLQAATEYYQGNTDKGSQLLAGLPLIEKEPYYNTILGLWLTEQGAYAQADFYLAKAVKLGNPQAKFYQAILASEANEIEKAVPLWFEVVQQKEQPQANKNLAAKILVSLQDSTKISDDTDRYHFIHYKKAFAPVNILQEVYLGMTEVNLRTKAGAEMIHLYLDRNQTASAEAVYQGIKTDKAVSPFIQSELNVAYLRLLTFTRDYAKITAEVDKLPLVHPHRNLKPYFKAVALEANQDYKNAETYYPQAAQAAPLHEEVVLASALFFQSKKQNADKAYQVLVEAVRGGTKSTKILQAYALQSIEVGLDYYGTDILPTLEKLMPADAFATFRKGFLARKEAVEKARGLAQ
jgi:hypothetical protein